MEAINRAIEDAADFVDFRDRLIQPAARRLGRTSAALVAASALATVEKSKLYGREPTGIIVDEISAMTPPLAELARQHPRRPGENRAQHRARLAAAMCQR